MPAENIVNLGSSITPEDEAKLAKLDALIDLRDGLQHDAESLTEIFSEIIEQRTEHARAAGLDLTPLTTSLAGLKSTYESLQSEVRKLRLSVSLRG